MKLKADKENDALYFRLDDSKIIESEEIEKGLILDYNSDGEIVGIELLNVSHRSSKINMNSLIFETI
jgi:uncharacterized protein YuzE